MLENDMCKVSDCMMVEFLVALQEMQNGRLFRLLGMLEMVCDRNLLVDVQ